MSLSDYGINIVYPTIIGVIYKITNTESNKCYIGQTRRNTEIRFIEHLTGFGSKDLLKDIVINGISTFKFEILETIDKNMIDIDALEDTYIQTLNCLHPNGYNRKVNHSILANGEEINLNTIQIEGKYVFESNGMKVFSIGELSQSRAFQILTNIIKNTETQKLKLKQLFNFKYIEILIETEDKFFECQTYNLNIRYNFIDDIFTLK